VGSEEELLSDRLSVRDMTWLSMPPPGGPIGARVKIRYRHEEAPAIVQPLADGGAMVRFETPQRAVTPGQAAVFYDGEVCLGGGWIADPR